MVTEAPVQSLVREMNRHPRLLSLGHCLSINWGKLMIAQRNGGSSSHRGLWRVTGHGRLASIVGVPTLMSTLPN
jgi:hypothetical protein